MHWDYTSSISGTIDDAASNFNISLPWSYPGSNGTSIRPAFLPPTLSTPTFVAQYYNDVMLCYNGTLPSAAQSAFFGATKAMHPYTYFAVNLNASKGAVGPILWSQTFTPTNNATIISRRRSSKQCLR